MGQVWSGVEGGVEVEGVGQVWRGRGGRGGVEAEGGMEGEGWKGRGRRSGGGISIPPYPFTPVHNTYTPIDVQARIHTKTTLPNLYL